MVVTRLHTGLPQGCVQGCHKVVYKVVTRLCTRLSQGCVQGCHKVVYKVVTRLCTRLCIRLYAGLVVVGCFSQLWLYRRW